MPKISLIGWVWNPALFWQLISCYELSSCHKKKLTSEIDWVIANPTVCQKTVWLVEFEIFSILTAYQLLRAVKLSQKIFDSKKLLGGYISSYVPNLRSLGCL